MEQDEIWRHGRNEGLTDGIEMYEDEIFDALMKANLLTYDYSLGSLASNPEYGELSDKLLEVVKSTSRKIWKKAGDETAIKM